MTKGEGKTLVVAEKPSVARDLARVLGCRDRLEGAIGGKDYIVTWAIGHLISLMEPDDLDGKYQKWRMTDLPILPDNIPTKVLPKTKSQYQIIKKWLSQPEITQVICATDAGREGELIFRYIYAQAKSTKPAYRLWISSMTDQAIRDGFAQLRPDSEYDALYVSARCRAEADWLVGMNATRAYTLRFNALLSVGRVQTPTLKLIVARDREIQSFKPEEYYEIRADFGDYTGVWIDPQRKDSHCPTREKAEEIKTKVRGRVGRVEESRRETKSMPPPQLFDLTALQREANQLLGLSAAKTLSIAQALYEKHKMITYPRTDSRCLSRDMIPRIQKTLQALPAPYAPYAQSLLPKQPVKPRVYNDAKVSDHHAIVPTGQFSNLAKLSETEKRVFDMIVKRLLAAHYPDYVYESATIITNVEGESFKTTGATPVSLGWKALYPAKKDEAAKEATVPGVAVGETRAVQKVSVKKCQTKPPAPHTDASLLYMMEHAGNLVDDEALRERMKRSGLGTPATRAAIIERLAQVGYIERRGKTLASTVKGQHLIDVVPDVIQSPEMTGKWEKALYDMARENDAIARAQLETRFLESIRRYAAFLVDTARESESLVQFEREEKRKGASRAKSASKITLLGRKCPLCKEGEVQANAKAFGCSRWREGCKFTIWRNQFAKQSLPNITVNQMKNLLDGKSVPLESGVLAFADGRVVWKRDPQ